MKTNSISMEALI